MSTGSAPGSESVVLFLAFLVLIMLRRVYRSYRGMRFSMARTIGYAIIYVIMGSLFSTLSFFEGVPLLLSLPYTAILVFSAVWSYRFSDRRITFWREGGSVYFKGAVLLYLIYVTGFVARISIGVVAFGPDIFSISPGGTLSNTALYATVATDILMLFGLGLLVGRNARVVRRYRLIEQGKEMLPESPHSYEPLFGSHETDAPSHAYETQKATGIGTMARPDVSLFIRPERRSTGYPISLSPHRPPVRHWKDTEERLSCQG